MKYVTYLLAALLLIGCATGEKNTTGDSTPRLAAHDAYLFELNGFPSRPSGDPEKLEMRVSLTKWVILANERLDKGDAAAVTGQACQLIKEYGPHDILLQTCNKGITVLLKNRDFNTPPAQIDAETSRMIETYGNWPPLLLDQAQAKHLQGDYRAAAAIYSKLIHLTDSEQPIHSKILMLAGKAVNAVPMTKADLVFFDESRRLVAGKAFKDCEECPEMLGIPAGNFDMGSSEPTNRDEWPAHGVQVKAFALGKYEVTQGQWRALMGTKPSRFSACGDNCPVDSVSWADAQAYVQKLSAKTGKRYRLPSEAEWEYACKAGQRTLYCGGDLAEGVAWHKDNSGDKTHEAGSKQQNAFGLYDMSGNVSEWLEDCPSANYVETPRIAIAWTAGNCDQRRLRGGAWSNPKFVVRATVRNRNVTTIRDDTYGLRVALSPPATGLAK